MCESRSMVAGVQHARSREVFGCEPVEGMGAVYSRADRELSTQMQGDDRPFIVLTETKFSSRCIPV
jgi:hypothetical protein